MLRVLRLIPAALAIIGIIRGARNKNAASAKGQKPSRH
jgi:hypothetical protein